MYTLDYRAIQRARKAAKITQEDLAAALGINRATVSKYETGAITPSIKQLQQISEILGVRFIDLLGLEPEGNNEQDRNLLIRLLDDYANSHGELDANILASLYFFDENGLRFRDGGILDRLVAFFDELNEEGQQIALERIAELTEIPKYQK